VGDGIQRGEEAAGELKYSTAWLDRVFGGRRRARLRRGLTVFKTDGEGGYGRVGVWARKGRAVVGWAERRNFGCGGRPTTRWSLRRQPLQVACDTSLGAVVRSLDTLFSPTRWCLGLKMAAGMQGLKHMFTNEHNAD
jgi:hypothetical protein